jgi:outer membrane lipoprotein SlyB
MTSKVTENMIDTLSRCCRVEKKCMRSVGLQRKSDYFSCMYGDAPKIAWRSGKMQASGLGANPAWRLRPCPCNTRHTEIKKEDIMSTPPNLPQKHHPMMIIAAAAVALFCAVGIAAMMGWLPSSIGSNASARTEQQQHKQEQEREQKAQAADQVAADKQQAAERTDEKQAAQRADEKQAAQRADEKQAAQRADEKQAAQRADEKQAKAQAAIEAPCSNCGVVQSVREIHTRAEGSGMGAAGGAVVGGLLGNQIGGGSGRQLATIAGAIGGAVAGNQIEGNVSASRSYDITVQLDNGATRTIRQSAQPRWRAGDQVRIVDGQIRSGS